MIGYLTGKIINVDQDRVVLLAGPIGFEILLPAITLERVKGGGDDQCAFYIYFHQTDRQPRPVLIGFETEQDKAFFQQFIAVGDIGPLKAVKAMTVPVSRIAAAIEQRDVAWLKQLKGIGQRTAEKIIATLAGKLGEFADLATAGVAIVNLTAAQDRLVAPVMTVLVEQLGHKTIEARRMIDAALKRNPQIDTVEALVEAVYRERPAA
jgi:Holliday junction DNA helicase RuvA